ncbi:MAG: ParM/StbA family protein [Anaerolineae bacterium]|nr:ParM/StbA family protein [Anaerolineae bacterium]
MTKRQSKKTVKTHNGLVIAVADAGNGDNDVIIGGDRTLLPSVCARTDGDTLGFSSDIERKVTYFDWKGRRYMAGDDVLATLPNAIENHLGKNRYGNDLQQRLLAYTLALGGVGAKGPQHVDLTLLAPPGLFTELKPQIVERFRAAGPVEIHMKGEPEPRRWQYDSIQVLPEGITAAFALAFDRRGLPTQTKDLNGLTLMVDCGMYTMNVIAMLDGAADMENLHLATTADAGLDKRIRQPLLKLVHGIDPNFAVANAHHVDAAMRDPDHILRVGVYETDLSQALAAYGEEYAGWIANFIDSHFSGGAGFSKILLIGGGAYLIADPMREWFGDKIIQSKIEPNWLNAEGAYRLRLAKLAAQR